MKQQTAILRFDKHQGYPDLKMEDFYRQKQEQPDADGKEIIHLAHPPRSCRDFIRKRIDEVHCRQQKTSVRFIDTTITASPVFFEGKDRETLLHFFQYALGFLQKKIGKENIVSAVVHLDQKLSKMNVMFVPLTADSRLSARELIGNRSTLIQWQDDFYKYMLKEFPDLQRFGPNGRQRSKPLMADDLEKAAKTDDGMAKMIELLKDTNMFRAIKNQEQVLKILKQKFPSMVHTREKLLEYEKVIAALKKDNEKLEKKVSELEKKISAKKPSIMEILQRQEDQELKNLRKIVAQIPIEFREKALTRGLSARDLRFFEPHSHQEER